MAKSSPPALNAKAHTTSGFEQQGPHEVSANGEEPARAKVPHAVTVYERMMAVAIPDSKPDRLRFVAAP